MARMKRISVFLFLSFPILTYAQQKASLLSYDLNVNIEPQAGTIAVQGSVEVPLEKPNALTFKFNLHESLSIKKLSVDGMEAPFEYTAMEGQLLLPASRGVIVNLPSGVSQSKIRVDIAYDGRMKVLPEFGASPDMRHSLDDQVNDRMVELAAYSSWYPQFAFGRPLGAKVTLSLPQKWISICSGKKLDERIQGDRVVTHWSSPKDMDIVILASPSYKQKSIHEAGIDLDIYHTQMPGQFIAQEGKQISSVIKLFSDALGQTNIPNGTVKHVYSPKRKGQGKAGYARPGLIVTSEGLTLEALARDPGFSLFQGIAHEVAHYWWNFGAGQGDWINEAFAEYFSAVAVEELSSEQEFRNIIAEYRKQAGDLPPDASSLSTVGMDGQSSFVVRYYKGALMLDSLRQAMGDRKFFHTSSEFFQTYTGKPTATEEFRSFWKLRLENRQDLIDLWLDSRGGSPEADNNQPGK
jgi:hypothetical protein